VRTLRRPDPGRTQRTTGSREVYSISPATEGHSDDLHRRRRNYLVSMGLRVVLFPVAALLFEGWLRLVMLAFVLVMPGIAVIFANNSGARRQGSSKATTPERAALPPGPRPAH
jgi:Flp pilus assembly protein TadB